MSERITSMCPRCSTPASGPTSAGGPCPRCGTPSDGPPPERTAPPPRRFNFPCPRCACLLEATDDLSDRFATCPTCAARLTVPRLNRHGEPERALTPDADDQDPTPMHAYAACGARAPRIHYRRDGTAEIECPCCAARAPVTANACPHCGAPFTMDEVPIGNPREGWLGVAALILGAVAVPLCLLVVPGLIALAIGLAGWLRQGRTLPEGQVLIGLLLAALALLLGLILHL